MTSCKRLCLDWELRLQLHFSWYNWHASSSQQYEFLQKASQNLSETLCDSCSSKSVPLTIKSRFDQSFFNRSILDIVVSKLSNEFYSQAAVSDSLLSQHHFCKHYNLTLQVNKNLHLSTHKLNHRRKPLFHYSLYIALSCSSNVSDGFHMRTKRSLNE